MDPNMVDFYKNADNDPAKWEEAFNSASPSCGAVSGEPARAALVVQNGTMDLVSFGPVDFANHAIPLHLCELWPDLEQPSRVNIERNGSRRRRIIKPEMEGP